MPVCNACDQYFTGQTCRCGASADTGADGKKGKDPTVNYCEFGNCGVPASIGQAMGLHLPRYCPWHREIDRLEPDARAEANTFERFQAWRKARAGRSPISDQTVWDAMHGARQLTYRPVRR